MSHNTKNIKQYIPGENFESEDIYIDEPLRISELTEDELEEFARLHDPHAKFRELFNGKPDKPPSRKPDRHAKKTPIKKPRREYIREYMKSYRQRKKQEYNEYQKELMRKIRLLKKNENNTKYKPMLVNKK